MRYYKIVKDGYVVAVGTGPGGTEVPKEEYDVILQRIRTRPEAEPGWGYRLKEDLSWEPVQLPPQPEEPEEPEEEAVSGDELLQMLQEVL